ncbi:MAG: YhjD/YihY/BrkB family envelope integrity protein [Planctomycetaceae bacterium]
MRKIRRAYERIFEFEARDLARIPRVLLRLARMLLLVPREFLKDHGFQWAAALAYYTLLSLIPLGILAFSLADVFEKFFNLDEKLADLLLREGLPDAAMRAGDEVRDAIEKARGASGRMGVIGTLLLVITSLGLFSALERALNRVWKVEDRRTAFQRFRAFWLVLTLAPVLFGLSVWATAKLRSAGLQESLIGVGFLLRAGVYLLPFVITWTAFFLLYVFLPNTRVKTTSALVGAVVAGSLWEVAKWGFNLYVANASQIDKVYGPLGILPLFIFWIYITWSILLSGGALAYVDQNYLAISSGVRGQAAESGAPREFHAIRLLVETYRRFRAGEEPPDLFQLSSTLTLRTETARGIALELERAGLLRCDEGGRYLPAREARRIGLRDIVAAVRGTAPEADAGASPAFQEAFRAGEEARYASFGESTLEDLMPRDADSAA